MIALPRKKIISELADFISADFSNKDCTNLLDIAESESLPVHFDHYEDCFDGMLVHNGLDFHIHVNLDKGNTPTSKRGRFTLSHELGHYFIDEHRIGLKYGLLEPHQSFSSLNQINQIEHEADFFASCLLMPSLKYKTFCAKKPFSFDLLHSISEHFQTSLVASILKFIDLGSREFMVVISKEGIVKWYSKSYDFPGFAFRFGVGKDLPKGTLAYNSSSNKTNTIDQSEIEDVDPETWFYINDNRANKQMFEQCYYSDINQYLITLIWFK